MVYNRILNLILIILMIVGLTLNQQRPTIDQNSHSFSGAFSFNWTAGYCYAMKGTQNQCDPSMLKLWDSKSFVIHGLWPSSQTQKVYQDFNLSYVMQNKKLLQQMWNLMPPQTNYPLKKDIAGTFNHYWLWQHEMNKHGKDFINILQVFYPQKYKNVNNKVLQQAFFAYTLEFYESKFKSLQKIPPFSQKSSITEESFDKSEDFILTKDQFAKIMKVPSTSFMAICQKEDVLSEIRICWRMQANTGLYDINCKIIQNQTIYPLTDTCPEKFKMLQYGKYGRQEQRRVWRTPSKKQLKSIEMIQIQ